MKGPRSAAGGVLLAIAVGAALFLGAANLGAPSIWHDESVHVFVGESIALHGKAQLPGGEPYFNGSTFNVVLAAAIRLFGKSEVVVRSPSVAFAAINVLLTFFLLRTVLGRGTALTTALFLSVSPWAVAWSREARFYSLQQTLYLATLGLFWLALQSKEPRKIWMLGSGALLAYFLGLFTSFHSILFLAAPGVYSAIMFVLKKDERKRWGIAVGVIAAAGIVTLLSYTLLMNTIDREAVFDRGGLGGEIVDPQRAVRSYYTHWLRLNLSLGFFMLALFGSAAMLVKEPRKGLYPALAFWVPLLVLTFFIGYRRPRFMFFVYPLYVAAYSYGAVVLVQWLMRVRKTPFVYGAIAVLALFGARLVLSTVYLTGDALEAASGASTTLARRHPQWREPCTYVLDHDDGRAILTTTYLPTLYYVGRVTNWYPSRYIWWEADEAGMKGLEGLEELKAFVETHPRGYFLAEWWRWQRNEFMAEEIAWVDTHMRKIDDASSEDVALYIWGD